MKLYGKFPSFIACAFSLQFRETKPQVTIKDWTFHISVCIDAYQFRLSYFLQKLIAQRNTNITLERYVLLVLHVYIVHIVHIVHILLKLQKYARLILLITSSSFWRYCNEIILLFCTTSNKCTQLFHKSSHCYMFRHYRVILREPVSNILTIYTSITTK